MVFLKRLLALCILLVAAWVPARGLLDKEYVESEFGRTLDDIIDYTVGQFYWLTGIPLESKYLDEIKLLNARQIVTIIRDRSRYGSENLLLYIYSLDNRPSYVNFSDMEDIRREYDKEDVLVLAVGVEKDKVKLANFLQSQSSRLALAPVMLTPGEEGELLMELKRLGTNYSVPPYIGFVDRTSIVTNIPTGPNRGARIRSHIDSAAKK